MLISEYYIKNRNKILFFFYRFKGGKNLKNKKVTCNIINVFNVDKDKTKEDLKLIFNKKLLKVIISTEKNFYEGCNSSSEAV